MCKSLCSVRIYTCSVTNDYKASSSQVQGIGLLNQSAPRRPAFLTTSTSNTVTRANLQFPGRDTLGFAVKVVDAENTVKGRWHAMSSFFRWDAETGGMWFYTQRFTQLAQGQDKYKVDSYWAVASEMWRPLFEGDTDLNLDQTARWVPGVCVPGTTDPLFAVGGIVLFCEWWIKRIATLPQDDPASGIVMRPHHQNIRSQYADDGYVHFEYAGLVLSDADTYRRFATLAFVPDGASVLDLACGVGTVGSLVMQRLAAAGRNHWNVYFTDSSAKMIEFTRNDMIRRFGQPPANQRRFQVCNATNLQQRHELKRALGKPKGFDVVLASKFVNHFTEDSLRPLLVALLDLCAPDGAVIFDMPLPCKYHQTVLGDNAGQLTGGILEVDARPLAQQLQRSDLTITNNSPAIQGINSTAPRVLGSHFMRDKDLESARTKLKSAVNGILFAEVDTVQWERDRSRFRDETAAVETAANVQNISDARVRRCDRDVRRDFVRYKRGSQVGQSSSGPVIRRAFQAGVICRMKKGS